MNSLAPETLASREHEARPGQIVGVDVRLWKRKEIPSKISDPDPDPIPDFFTLMLYVKFWDDTVYLFYLNMEEIVSILQKLGSQGTPGHDEFEKKNLEGLFVHVKYEGGSQGSAMLIAIFGKDGQAWQPSEPIFAYSISRFRKD